MGLRSALLNEFPGRSATHAIFTYEGSFNKARQRADHFRMGTGLRSPQRLPNTLKYQRIATMRTAAPTSTMRTSGAITRPSLPYRAPQEIPAPKLPPLRNTVA